MIRFYAIGFILLLFFDTLGQTAFKFTALSSSPLEYSLAWLLKIITNVWFYITLISYSGAFFTWMKLLRKAPVGPAFAASHLQIVSVMVVSIFIFNEHLTLTRLFGAILIISGIVFLALAEKKLHSAKSTQ